jgi:hypothetical protein
VIDLLDPLGDFPTIFVAVTEYVYVPFVVLMVADVVVDVATILLPGFCVTVYPVIGDPPFAGAFHETVAFPPFPGVTVTPVGAPGTFHVVADFRAGCDTPTTFVAVTANEYAVPAVNPVTVADVLVVVIDLLPGVAVTV